MRVKKERTAGHYLGYLLGFVFLGLGVAVAVFQPGTVAGFSLGERIFGVGLGAAWLIAWLVADLLDRPPRWAHEMREAIEREEQKAKEKR